MKTECNIFWFRRDLRLKDNCGLFHALKGNLPVLPVFIFDTNILDKLNDKEDKRIQLIYSALLTLKNHLNKSGRDLLVLTGDPIDVFKKLSNDYLIRKVYTNEDYEPYAIKRDLKVKKALEKKGIDFNTYKDQCIFAKNEILKADGSPYTVYTPYKNKWLEHFGPNQLAPYSSERYLKNLLKGNPSPLNPPKGFIVNDSEVKPYRFKKNLIEKYEQNRDIPGLLGTSRISHYLRFGLVSPRQCALKAYENSPVWLSELIWREFFMQILFHFPNSQNKSFREKYDNIKWRKSRYDFEKWCRGETGYPLVDAGMRELNATGFMHNRVRMVAASFLVKHLLIDWRLGERYFARKLLDFDLALNIGNWQWVAGSGCDAAPYFRIFNPTTQQKKFDPDFEYINKWIPEFGSNNYPEPMVDHSFAYNRALATYKKGLS